MYWIWLGQRFVLSAQYESPRHPKAAGSVCNLHSCIHYPDGIIQKVEVAGVVSHRPCTVQVHRETPNERAAMMAQKTADSVKLVVTSSPPDRDGNEAELIRQATEFFGHDGFTHTGFRHSFEPDERIDDPDLRTYAIFYDETPYE